MIPPQYVKLVSDELLNLGVEADVLNPQIPVFVWNVHLFEDEMARLDVRKLKYIILRCI